MNRNRLWHSSCWLGEHQLVVTGGMVRAGTEIKITQSYDTSKVEWKQLPDINHGRMKHSSAAFNNNTIYIFGGLILKTGKFVNSIERFVDGETSWTIIESKGDPFIDQSGHKSIAIDSEFILIFGGANKKSTFEFNPETFKFKQVGDMVDVCTMDKCCTEPVYD